MKSAGLIITRIALFLLTLFLWQIVISAQLSPTVSLIIIVGTILLVYPVVWFGRKIVDIEPSKKRLEWITTSVHFFLMVLLGASIIMAIRFFRTETGPTIPLPQEIGWLLLVISLFLLFFTVVNLAVSGWGAPFAIFLSKRIADRWMYRYTRNPMVLNMLITLISIGLFLQSSYFILWVIVLFAPAIIIYLKVYEEHELEIRFGAPYLEYKAKTPFLWPGKPQQP